MKIDRDRVIVYASQHHMSLGAARDVLVRQEMVRIVNEAQSVDDLRLVLIEIINRME